MMNYYNFEDDSINSRLYVEKIKLKACLPMDSYLKKIPAVRHLEKARELCFEKRVTFIVGENGSGKSTLAEAIAIACGFNPEGGTNTNLSLK